MTTNRAAFFLAVALVCLGNTQSRAGQVFRFSKPANATAEQMSAPVAMQDKPAPEQPEVLPAPGQSKPIPDKQETLPSPRQTAPAPAEKKPSSEPSAAPAQPAEGEAPCGADCHGHHLTCEKLKAWICFRPARDLCPACCSKFQPCCTPELYTYFLCRYGPNGPCCPGGGCAGGSPACGARAGCGTCATTGSAAEPHTATITWDEQSKPAK